MIADTYQTGDGPVTRERLLAIIAAAQAATPDHCGVTVLVVPFGQPGELTNAAYASTGRRDDMILALRGMLGELESTL